MSYKNHAIKSYRIGEHIKLELIDDETIIFVNGEEFDQCRALILNIPIDKRYKYDNIDSINEANEIAMSRGEGSSDYDSLISSQEEFWGHCSNIQAFYENNYDTRLLEYNFAFSLLEKIVDDGDAVAEKALKIEIARRLESKYLPVITRLAKKSYLGHLTNEEIDTLIKNKDISNQRLEHALPFLWALGKVKNPRESHRNPYKDYPILMILPAIRALCEEMVNRFKTDYSNARNFLKNNILRSFEVVVLDSPTDFTLLATLGDFLSRPPSEIDELNDAQKHLPLSLIGHTKSKSIFIEAAVRCYRQALSINSIPSNISSPVIEKLNRVNKIMEYFSKAIESYKQFRFPAHYVNDINHPNLKKGSTYTEKAIAMWRS